MKAWLEAGIAPPVIAVNLSTLQFKTPLELESNFHAILAETGVPPQRVELELTESVLMDASREHGDILLRLREAGFRIAIDDFGTGFSSLMYLRRYPVDRIKIAQEFMVDMAAGSSNAAIVQAAIALARALKLDVIVEGVETAAQLALVRSMGAHEVQGYYYSKPLAAGRRGAAADRHVPAYIRAIPSARHVDTRRRAAGRGDVASSCANHTIVPAFAALSYGVTTMIPINHIKQTNCTK